MQVFALTGQQNELMTTALTREQPARWTSQGQVGRLYDEAGPVTGPVCPSQQPHAHALIVIPRPPLQLPGPPL